MISKSLLNDMYRYAISLTHNDDLAFDLVHDSLLKIQGRIIINKKSYLKRTIRNHYYDTYKARLKSEGDSKIESINTISFEDISLKRFQISDVLEILTPEERELLFLIAVEEYSYKEAAQLTGLKIGTVMSRLHRCKEKIKHKEAGHE